MNVENQYTQKYGCINTGCKGVFRLWISAKLKYLAIVGYTISVVGIITIGLSITFWMKLSNNQLQAMWHHRVIEIAFLSITIILIIVLGALTGV